ncbi:MAG: Na+:H+ antiporter, NhaA family, partial [Campylobacterota bacterium]|nr:Na+:H+ antiporter, NhaA family [Campylobacterota bacterium]
IFVADLAFAGNDSLIFQAKVGILTASLIAGLIGYFWLKNAKACCDENN